MKVEFREISDEVLDDMAAQMRPMDLLEFELMSGGMTVIQTLEHLRRRSRRCKAAYVDGRLACCYGIVPTTLISTDGNPWLCATDLINIPQVRREFIARTRDEAHWMLAGFESVWNFVHCDNRVAIRWLKWIGFDFGGAEISLGGHRFIRFGKEI